MLYQHFLLENSHANAEDRAFSYVQTIILGIWRKTSLLHIVGDWKRNNMLEPQFLTA